MRVVLVLIVLLALTGEARAEVFVPSDPPPRRDARCGAAAGDVVAADTNRVLVVSTADGPWQEIAGLNGCPALAAAADGTAAIVATNADVGGAAMVVRPPGGTFGAPVPIGESAETPSVAAAPGGWIIVGWQSRADNSLMAMIVRPDGTTARAELDRVSGSVRSRQFLGQARLAIDAGGNATVVWSRSSGSRVRLRIARAVAGAAPVVGADLPGASSNPEALALAGAPLGHTLLTWAGKDGLHAMVDGQAPVTVDATTEVTRAVASITDDGAAVIVYSSSRGEIVAVDRAATGGWAIPHVLGSPPPREDGSSTTADEPSLPLVTLAPGGRATAAWSARRDDVRSVSATVGQAGGAWAPATALSSVTRDAAVAGLTATRVLWTEIGRGVLGATRAPAPTDTTPPTLTAAFPKRVAPTRTGRIELAVRVDCSEPCDVRLTASAGDVRGGRVARAVTPGRVATLRLPGAPDFERQLLLHPRSRKVRLELLASDRSGNLTRQTHTLRVRVIKRPPRESRGG